MKEGTLSRLLTAECGPSMAWAPHRALRTDSGDAGTLGAPSRLLGVLSAFQAWIQRGVVLAWVTLVPQVIISRGASIGKT